MELIRQYRRKALMPWLACGGVCVAVALVYGIVARGKDHTGTWLFLAVYAVALLVFNFRAITGIGAKEFRRYTQGFTPGQMAELERQFSEGDNLGHVVMTDRCMVIMSKQTLSAIPYTDIVWVYQAGQTTRLTGKVQTMVVITPDKKNHLVDLFGGKEKGFQPVSLFLGRIRKMAPGAYIGREKEITQLYRQDFPSMARAAVRENGSAQ